MSPRGKLSNSTESEVSKWVKRARGGYEPTSDLPFSLECLGSLMATYQITKSDLQDNNHGSNCSDVMNTII